MKIRIIVGLVFAFLAITSSRALAQSPTETPVCLDVVDAMNFALQGMPKEGVTGISFKEEGKTTHMLFLAVGDQRSNIETDRQSPWRLLQKQGDSLVYCLVGAGKTMEVLEDPSFFDIGDSEFGLPGSGKRRCNDETDGPLGGVFVRAWATKELGPSTVNSFSETFRGESFMLVLSKIADQGKFPWILIQSNEGKSCYYSRGSDTSFAFDFVMRPDLIVPDGTLPSLEE